jgi:hypothetical protein
MVAPGSCCNTPRAPLSTNSGGTPLVEGQEYCVLPGSATYLVSDTHANDATRKGGTGPTPFQSSVYLAVWQVPVGQVTTYKHIATHISCKCSQAVGLLIR